MYHEQNIFVILTFFNISKYNPTVLYRLGIERIDVICGAPGWLASVIVWKALEARGMCCVLKE